jgi:hypothetical protein
MTDRNTPQLSLMDLANHCAAFPGLSLLNTRELNLRRLLALKSNERLITTFTNGPGRPLRSFSWTVTSKYPRTELETSARTESKRMSNHNAPQLSRMDLANHCAAFPGLSRLNTRTVCTGRRGERSMNSLPCTGRLAFLPEHGSKSTSGNVIFWARQPRTKVIVQSNILLSEASQSTCYCLY